jgi:hypothetical protein
LVELLHKYGLNKLASFFFEFILNTEWNGSIIETFQCKNEIDLLDNIQFSKILPHLNKKRSIMTSMHFPETIEADVRNRLFLKSEKRQKILEIIHYISLDLSNRC